MSAFNKKEFWDELDATDETFVRRKYATGGYGAARQKVVAQWLQVKEEGRRQVREAKAFQWRRVEVLAAVVTAAGALVACWPK